MTAGFGARCGDGQLQAIIEAARVDSAGGVEMLDTALAEYPQDPRLHFLRGSLLIELKRFIEAHEALSRALAIEPEDHLARFQLGLFELTSGEADAAVATWAPLKGLPEDHWIACFVIGLEHLIADRFEACVGALRAGIAENRENPIANDDMAAVIAECEALLADRAQGGQHKDISATSMLLGTGGSSR